jgi:hypothetical protein
MSHVEYHHLHEVGQALVWETGDAGVVREGREVRAPRDGRDRLARDAYGSPVHQSGRQE